MYEIPGLNPKYLRSSYVLLIEIRRSDGDVKPGGSFDALERAG